MDRPTCEFDGPDADGLTWFRNDGADGGFSLVNLGAVDQQALGEAMALWLASKETDDPPFPPEGFVVPEDGGVAG